ncbi:IS1595 family transposase [Sphingomonas paeninsulae]|uniref:IS1595 family transposase n=1 Tax=Sphingomonas paeninsulae TaxID=2319844 RepID=A0A494TEV3_SPHPE|nr:IS1595 family transposase [Sphingomonas paeninsulae]AYJ85802.1 IS1595 family transposase [Sphingomonas paeninsulae]
MTNFTAPHFTDPDKAREHLEALRWPQGPYCPHCGSFKAQRLPAQRGKATKAHPDGAIRAGVIQCNDCRKQYSVTVATLFERSKVPLNKWLLATFLLSSSKKGMSAHQLHRMLGVTYKTAWFMFHRIREAMREDDNADLGANGGMVEVDETFIGRDPSKEQKRGGAHHKMKVVTLVDRETGVARSRVVENIRIEEIGPIVRNNLAAEARLMTDELLLYRTLGRDYADHQVVSHGKEEYVRGEAFTNTVEGFFSIFKRGMKGIYQHCGKQHLHRYLAEFDFRYSNRIARGVDDTARTDQVLRGIGGRRLMYRRPSFAA